MIINDILLSITLVAAVVVPTWFLVWASGKTRRALTKELIKLNKNLPETHDIWGRRAIAITSVNCLTFIDLHHQKEEVLDLESARDCYLLLNKQKYSGGSVDLKKADTFDLVVDCKGKLTNFNFYNSNDDDPVNGGEHILIAKKWLGIIRSAIKQKV